MNILKLSALIAVGAVTLFAAPSDVKAGTTHPLNAYPCGLYSYYQNGNYTVTMYTGPACTGTYVDTIQVRTPFYLGADGYHEAMLPAMVTATANDTRITGTYTTYYVFNSETAAFDNIQFNAN